MLAEKIDGPARGPEFSQGVAGIDGRRHPRAPPGRRPDPWDSQRQGARDPAASATWAEEEIAQFEASASGRLPRPARIRAIALSPRNAGATSSAWAARTSGTASFAVRQQKTGAVLEIPVLPELQEILAAHPVDNMTLLTTTAGKPFTAAGFTGWFRDRCREAGLPLGLSGSRTCARPHVRRFAEAGLHGPPNRGVFRPRFLEGSPTLHQGRRPKTARRRRDGSPRRQTRGEQKLANPKERFAKMNA